MKEETILNNEARTRGSGGAYFYLLLGWLIPGGGHLAQKRWGRGLLFGGAVCLMFILGRQFGGNLQDITNGTEGLLPRVFGAFNLGTGVLYLGSWLSGTGFGEAEDARRISFEYGNTFLMVAGLLNYLIAFDAFDIRVGRKK